MGIFSFRTSTYFSYFWRHFFCFLISQYFMEIFSIIHFFLWFILAFCYHFFQHRKKSHWRNLILYFLHDIYLCINNINNTHNFMYKKKAIKYIKNDNKFGKHEKYVWNFCFYFILYFFVVSPMPKINWNLMNFPLPFNIKKKNVREREGFADFSSAWISVWLCCSFLLFLLFRDFFGRFLYKNIIFCWNYPQSIIKPMTRVIKMNWLWTVSIVDLNFYDYILCFMGILAKVTCRWIATISTAIQTQKERWFVIAGDFYSCIKTHKHTTRNNNWVIQIT